MKKVLLPLLALAMIFSLAACSGETAATDESSSSSAAVTLADVATEQGINISLPSDMTLQESSKAYVNSATGENAVFATATCDPAAPLSAWSQEDFVSTQLNGRKDLNVISYDNNKQLDGQAALVCKISYTSDAGNAITATIVMIDIDTSEYIVSLMYPSDLTDGSLATNLDTCVDSITIPTV